MISSESKVHCGSAVRFVPGVSGLPYYRAPFGARGNRRGFSPAAAARHSPSARANNLEKTRFPPSFSGLTLEEGTVENQNMVLILFPQVPKLNL